MHPRSRAIAPESCMAALVLRCRWGNPACHTPRKVARAEGGSASERLTSESECACRSRVRKSKHWSRPQPDCCYFGGRSARSPAQPVKGVSPVIVSSSFIFSHLAHLCPYTPPRPPSPAHTSPLDISITFPPTAETYPVVQDPEKAACQREGGGSAGFVRAPYTYSLYLHALQSYCLQAWTPEPNLAYTFLFYFLFSPIFSIFIFSSFHLLLFSSLFWFWINPSARRWPWNSSRSPAEYVPRVPSRPPRRRSWVRIAYAGGERGRGRPVSSPTSFVGWIVRPEILSSGPSSRTRSHCPFPPPSPTPPPPPTATDEG